MTTTSRPIIAAVAFVAKEEAAATPAEATEARIRPEPAPAEVGVEVATAAEGAHGAPVPRRPA